MSYYVPLVKYLCTISNDEYVQNNEMHSKQIPSYFAGKKKNNAKISSMSRKDDCCVRHCWLVQSKGE